jgi:DNA-binding CsgD family transcriptional regulator
LVEYLGGAPDAARPLFAEALTLARRIGVKAHIVYALIGMALAGQDGDDPGWSTRLHGAADQALADLGHTLDPLESRLASSDRQRLRAMMGDDAFEAEYAVGRTIDLGRAADQALRDIQAARPASPSIAISAEDTSLLTARELDVVRLLAQGLSNSDIARRLVLSEHTVHRHLSNAYRKLGISSRTAAVAWCVRTGLIEA